jgi:hypothetical protein
LSDVIGPANVDFNGDNKSNLLDYNIFAANFTDGTPPPAPATVPLPAGLWLLLTAVPLLRRRQTS